MRSPNERRTFDVFSPVKAFADRYAKAGEPAHSKNNVNLLILANILVHDENHLKVLRLLELNPRINQRDLAEGLGVSVGKTNYCLKALLDKGLIKIQNFRNSQNKLAYVYLLTPAGISAKAELTTQFLKRKVAEYELLEREIELLRQEAADLVLNPSSHEDTP